MITNINEFKKHLDTNYAPLYHGLKFEYAINALDNNKLDAYTFQRYWKDGKRRKDDQSDYNDSYYLRGLSLTRDYKYASNWSDIIFVFNKQKLLNKYKIVPYNWGYSIGGGYKQGSRVKREREEFLITGTIDKILTNKEIGKMIEKPLGSIEPLDKYLEGFYISKNSFENYGDNDNKNIKKLMENKYYLGII